ncbi:MAG: peptidoglycan DD-metalloendopeptidase family protein [Acidobacteriia bacterium]|nr:peptidoglycan DD-metalloendopeptidase family protein [Terriglobia bacterium]
MNQEYFVVVLAHSLRGRLRRIHIPHHAVYAILALALFGCISLFGLAASYARMASKVANYNALRREADSLRARYQSLKKEVTETHQQLATLEIYAKEVSIAYGIKQKLEGPADISAEGALVPSFPESLQDYNFLRSGDLLAVRSRTARRFQPVNSVPSIWPVLGPLGGGFGSRADPFSGEGEREFHTGVDIRAATGAAVRATGDGIVIHAQMTSGGYGRLVVVDHGAGYQTYYAHLSRVFVQVGQEVRRGDSLGAVGSSGRVTAPHLHYEVRVGGNPRKPYPFMKNPTYQTASANKDFPF